MTNLSKELCKVCGIKPEIITDYELNEIEVYPNFYQPENFVKLMELKIYGLCASAQTLIGLLNSKFWLCDRQDYIEFLYKYYIADLTSREQDIIKQAIRQQEWIYEKRNI